MLSTKNLRKIEFRTLEILEEFGFEEIHIPLIDFSSDRKAIQIREDFTSEIAKIFPNRKVYYRGSILRTTSFGKPREIYQIGCEIVRENSILKDDIFICTDVLNSIADDIKKITGYSIVLMIGHYGLTIDTLGENSDFFFRKDTTKISELIESGKLRKDIAQIFFKVITNIEEIKKVIQNVPEDLEIFSSRFRGEKIYNLSEKVEKSYYDGLIFYGFLDGMKFLSGGRYKIENKEGIGFSINLLSFEII
ncbi:MAG: ATP phosphoribosyltransferase regulatory subunit [Candidatus Calescibacterium sp.]|nr:ATP phosphoribosyltransferase regulatory subunit [Candidatus Calescibacterium sp.]MCX7734340.1 ATP phosphoribosyltransferase regulatory subunit [bacterium]MDW8087611.1 ATP phosphoribosyltransferase regulatory subunit [Candidatus Calescibacterium sp.]